MLWQGKGAATLELEVLKPMFSIVKLSCLEGAAKAKDAEFWFLSRTDEELSLVCPSACVPAENEGHEDGWRAFRIRGVLDFSLVGVLARISGLLADADIGLFVVSTYNTDYVLIKAEKLDAALVVLAGAGYELFG